MYPQSALAPAYWPPVPFLNHMLSRSPLLRVHRVRIGSLKSFFGPLGPVLMTVGPWKGVTIQSYKTRISDFRISTILDLNASGSDFLKGNVSFAIAGENRDVVALPTIAKSSGDDFQTLSTVSLDSGHGISSFSAKPGDLELWYPIGHGKQVMHRVELTVKDAVR